MHLVNTRSKWVVGATAVAALGGSLLIASPASADPGDVVITTTYDGAPVADIQAALYHRDATGAWNFYETDYANSDGSYTIPAFSLDDGDYATVYFTDGLPADVAPYATFQEWNGSTPYTVDELSTQFSVSGGNASIGSVTVPLVHNAGAIAVTARDAGTKKPYVEDASNYDDLYMYSDDEYNPVFGSGFGPSAQSLRLDQEDTAITGVLTQSHLLPGSFPRARVGYYNDNTDSGTYATTLPLVNVTVGATTTADITLVPNTAGSVDSLITSTWNPQITGSSTVGGLLTVSQPDAPGVTFSYQWYTVGSYDEVVRPIIGATSQTFVPTVSEYNQQLSVDVVASAPGYGEDYQLGNSRSKVITLGSPNLGTVAITGTASFGHTVAASVSTALAGANSFQWYLNGFAIAGADGSTYAIRATDVGSSLSVSVKSTVAGHNDAVIPSAGVIVTSDTANTGSIAITGSTKFGKTLKANVATTLAGNVSYKWFRNGILVGGIDGSSYTIAKADLGTTIAVSATSSVQGHTDAVLVATAVVAKDAASVKATSKGDKVTVTIKPGTSKISATAKVKVYYTATKFKTITVKSGKSASVTLTKLKKGKHTVKVAYPGTASYAAKTISIKVKVTK